ncbi:MAG: hypothetical protein MUO73_04805, partial [Thermoplasmata archaeon]|nr:hypothetical protein [Thermoplasmata archaeon]
MKQHTSIHQPHIKAKIVGSLLIIIGIVLLFNPNSLFLKLGFASLLIGIFMILMITERTIPKQIGDAQIEGNLDFIKKITKELNLIGNAIFLPKSNNLTEERIFIPLNKTTDIKLPEIDDDYVFSTGTDGKSLGISVPPSGLKLLKYLEAEGTFENAGLENIEEKLQTFIGIDLLKSVTFKKEKNGWNLHLEKTSSSTTDHPMCNQYPCPTCSAVLTAIT